MALTTRVWSVGKLLLLVGALLLTYVIFAGIGMRVALKAREVVVPGLAGKTVNEATALLTEAGLNLKVEEGRRLDAKVTAGQIVTQDPPAGLRTRRDRSVKVWVSGGPRSMVVPALGGEQERTAQLRLEQEGLGLSTVAEIRSADYPAGTIVAQFPAPKSSGSQVALLINRGEQRARYVMPDLIGVSGERAADLLRSRGFRATVVGEHPYPGVPPGIVLRQNPQAGFQIAPGEPISLEISRSEK
jgi:serine/threonine-protein kinase